MVESRTVLSFVGTALARFAATSFVLLGLVVVVVNLVDVTYSGWVLLTVAAAGTLGAAGGVVYLLGLDGPVRFRTVRTRRLGWAGMMVLALLPSSLTIPLVLMVLALTPTLRRVDG